MGVIVILLILSFLREVDFDKEGYRGVITTFDKKLSEKKY